MLNPEKTVITQYLASPVIRALLDKWNENLDPIAQLTEFYDSVWDITTASGYGLDIWGRIVGVSRSLQVPQTFSYFGFAEATGSQPFGSGVFYSGNGGGVSTLTLTDDVFRQLILLKSRANLTNGSAQSLNELLAELYSGRGRCYVVDNGDMSFVYVFKFILTPADYTLLAQSGVLPRSAGVSFSILQGF